jgi:hypothetical protein
VNGKTYYGMSMDRQKHDYLEDVCERYAEMLENQYVLEEARAREIAGRHQPPLSDFFPTDQE